MTLYLPYNLKVMRKQIQFQILFLGLGERLTHDWRVTATHVTEEHRNFDLEGDESNTPDLYCYMERIQVNDFTLGFDAGEINFKDLPADLRRQIIATGLKAANHNMQNEQRERIKTSLGHPV